MSWQATAWADSLPYDAVPALAFRVLVKLANAAAPDGSRAFRSKRQIADELGVSERSVQRAFSDLRAAALIRPGDQRIVNHMAPNRRPTVFDLAMPTGYKDVALIEAWNDPDSGETELSTGETSRGDKVIHRGDSHVSSGETTVVARTILELNNYKTKKNNDTKRSRGRAVKFSTAVCPTTMQKHRLASWGTCADCGERPAPLDAGAIQ